MPALKPSEYFQEDDSSADEYQNAVATEISAEKMADQSALGLHDCQSEGSSDSEWVNSSDDDQQQVSRLLGGAQQTGRQSSFKYDPNQQYDWIPNGPYSQNAGANYSNQTSDYPLPNTNYASPHQDTSTKQQPYDFPTGNQQTSYDSGHGGGYTDTAWDAPPPAPPTGGFGAANNHPNASDYYAVHDPERQYLPYGPPKYGKDVNGKPLILRVWESITWIYVLSVHAVRLPSDVPFGANFGGVNLFGIAFWGIPCCFMMEELYCNLAIALMTVNKKNLGPAAADLSSFTLAVYLGFWMMLAVLTLCRGMMQRRTKGAEPPLYNLRVISLLCGTSIPAAVGGYLWQTSLRRTWALKPSELFNVHTMPNPSQPASVILAAAPFTWPLILVTVCALFKLVFPKSLRKKKTSAY